MNQPQPIPLAPWPPLLGTASLTRRAYAGENLVPLGQALMNRALKNPRDAHAYLDFSMVLQLIGNREDAMAVQAEAIGLDPLYALPARREGPGLNLLVLMGPGDLMANTPVEFLVENSDVHLQLLYLLPDAEWPEEVPEHDVMLVAVGESETSRPLLQRLQNYVEEWPRPTINRPARIVELSRDSVSQLLQGAPGVTMPLTARVDRHTLELLSWGGQSIGGILPDGGFPVIARPLGSHAGSNLEKLDSPKDVAAYLERVEGERFYLSSFVDYRSADGQFRKYRIVLIEGQAYLCHLGISDHWIIHYANAGMSDSAAKRAEEALRMETFDTDFAVRHAEALKAIDERIGLNYVGIDCAESPTGELLIFEVDNAMVIHALDPEDIFPYKQPAMAKVFDAFRRMLENARAAG